MTGRLSRNFSISSLIAIALIAILLGLIYRVLATSQFEKQASQANTNLTHLFANTVLPNFEDILNDNMSDANLQLLNDKIQSLVKDLNITKVKIFNLTGFVTFSTVAEDIGNEVHSVNRFISARKGTAVSELKFKVESIGLDGTTIIFNRYIISSYIPIRMTKDKPVIGVFELYTDATDTANEIYKTESLIHASVFFLLFILYLYLLFFVRKADRIIEKNKQSIKIEQQEKIDYLATHDKATSLPNRSTFVADLDKQILNNHKQQLAVFAINIDRMHWLNDNYGDELGNKIIANIANHLSMSLRENDQVYSMGGDSFAILLHSATEKNHVQLIADRIKNIFSNTLLIDENEIQATISFGIAIYPEHSKSGKHLLSNAIAAMNCVKDIGGNNYIIYSQNLAKHTHHQHELEMELSKALELQQFEVYYQPKVDILHNKIIGAEALIRWNHPYKGQISPDVFIPHLEKTGQIIPLGQWILEQACKQCKQWHEYGYNDLSISVNVSPKQFSTDLLLHVIQALSNSDLSSEYLELEITESMLADNINLASDILNSLKKQNIKLSIDDFGTGYSSLHYLATFPVDILKVDRSFIMDIINSKRHASITSAILGISKALNMGTVIEGVEYSEQLDFVRDLGYEIVQGYFFSKPLPAGEFKKLLDQEDLLQYCTNQRTT